jgi:hypothetical protein
MSCVMMMIELIDSLQVLVSGSCGPRSEYSVSIQGQYLVIDCSLRIKHSTVSLIKKCFC